MRRALRQTSLAAESQIFLSVVQKRERSNQQLDPTPTDMSLSATKSGHMVMQAAQDWQRQNAADGLDGARYRRILIQ